MTKIIINALLYKKNGGGGSQIVQNFIKETLSHSEVEWFYFVSDDAHQSFGKVLLSQIENHYFYFLNQPNFHTRNVVQRRVDELVENIKPDVVYTILSPSYIHFSCKEVIRCCNAWDYSSHIPRYVWQSLSLKNKLQMRIKSAIKRHLMSKGKFFVTQTEVAAHGINNFSHCGLGNIKVVPNVLPATYQGFEVKKIRTDTLNMVFVTDPTPHKNMEIIPEVASILKNKYGINKFKFHVTIPFENKKYLAFFDGLLRKYGVEDNVVNEGYQNQEQLKKLYCRCDIYFFPSLFETFSVALLEAMYFKMPIVATDIDFNREVSQDAALYFEPKNADMAAKQITEIANDVALYNQMVKNGQERLKKYGDYNKHFCETMDFLIDCANK